VTATRDLPFLVHSPLPEGVSAPPRSRTSSLRTPEEVLGSGTPSPLELILLYLDSKADSGSPGASQREIVAAVKLSQPTVSRLLRRLMTRGDVYRRFQGPWGKRTWQHLYLETPSGRDRTRKIWDAVRQKPLLSGNPEFVLEDLWDLRPDLPHFLVLAWALEHGRGPAEDFEGHLIRFAEGSSPLPDRSSSSAELIPLVGRARERLAILGVLRQAAVAHTRGKVLVLVGPSGIGKTRLLHFAREVGLRRGFIVRSGTVQPDPRLPLSPFEEIFETWPSRLASRGIAPRLPMARRLLAYWELLRQASQEAPVLLLIDDLQWASPPSRTIFQFLARNATEEPARVCIMAALRGDEPGPRAAAAMAAVDRLVQSSAAQAGTVSLDPLSLEESEILLRTLLARAPMGIHSPTVSERLIRQARGNPLFLTELARDLKDPRNLSRSGATGAPVEPRTWPVPLRLQRLIRERWERLEPRTRRILELASLLGPDAPLIPVARHLRMGTFRQIHRELQALSGSLEWMLQGEGGTYSFRHPLVQQTVREIAGPRPEWFRALARWWETYAPQEADRIVRLYMAAGGTTDRRAAWNWNRRAVAMAMSRQAFDSIPELLERGHRLFPGDRWATRRQVQEELALARQLWVSGALAPAEEILVGLLRFELPPTLKWEATRLWINTLVIRNPARARQRLVALLQEVKGRGQEPGTSGLAPALSATAAWVECQLGHWNRVLSKTGPAVTENRSGDWEPRSLALVSRATALLQLGRFSDALHVCRTARRLAREEDGAPLQALVENLEGRVYLLQGNFSRALSRFSRGLRKAREVGSVSTMGSLLANTAAAHLHRGDVNAAQEVTEELLRLGRTFDVPVLHAWGLYRHGQICWLAGKWDECDDTMRIAGQAFRTAGLRRSGVLPLLYRQALRGRRGYSQTRRQAWASFERRTRLADIDERVPVTLFRASSWAFAGHPARARELLTQGIRQERKRGQRLWIRELELTLNRLSSSDEGGLAPLSVHAQGRGRHFETIFELSSPLAAERGINAGPS
jgi:tetratricopeptide (TPR) repeat protein